MTQFMLLLHDDPSDFQDASPEDLGRIIGEYVAWRQKLAETGCLVGGEKLADEGGKWMTQGEGGVSITDGPFSEAKEVLGGFFMIEAADYDGAVALAMDCPHLKYGKRIEVRAIESHDA